MKTRLHKPSSGTADSTQPNSPIDHAEVAVPPTSVRSKRSVPALEQLALQASAKRLRSQPPVTAKLNPAPNSKPACLADVPEEILNTIAQFLPADDLVIFASTNRQINGSVEHNFPLLKNDLDLLKQSAESLQELPLEERWPAFNTLLEMQSKFPNVPMLRRLASLIHCLPQDSRLTAVKAVFDKVSPTRRSYAPSQETQSLPNTAQIDHSHADLANIDYTAVLGELALSIYHLYQQDTSAVFHNVLDRSDDATVMEHLARLVYLLPQQEITKGFHAVLRKSDDVKVLQNLVLRLRRLPEKERTKGFHALFDKSDHVDMLNDLAGEIRLAIEEEGNKVFHKLLEKCTHPRAFSSLASCIYKLPDHERTSIFYLIFAKSDDPHVMTSLASQICELPEQQRARAFNVLVAISDNTEVLESLTHQIKSLPEQEKTKSFYTLFSKSSSTDVLPQQDRVKGFHALLGASDHVDVLEDLTYRICCLPERERANSFYALLDKCNTVYLIRKLAENNHNLPIRDRIAARRAIDKKRHHLLHNAQGNAE